MQKEALLVVYYFKFEIFLQKMGLKPKRLVSKCLRS